MFQILGVFKSFFELQIWAENGQKRSIYIFKDENSIYQYARIEMRIWDRTNKSESKKLYEQKRNMRKRKQKDET